MDDKQSPLSVVPSLKTGLRLTADNTKANMGIINIDEAKRAAVRSNLTVIISLPDDEPTPPQVA
jgi:hypothetical protein